MNGIFRSFWTRYVADKASSPDGQDAAYGCDFLARFVARVTRRTMWRAAVIVTVYQLVFYVIPGIVISWYYEGILPFVSIFEKREFAMSMMWQLVLPTCTFGFFVWQPFGIEALFRKLRENEVVSGLSDDVLLRNFLREHISKPLSSPLTMFAAISYALATIAFGAIPMWFSSESHPFWWRIHSFFYWGVLNTMFFIAGYVIAWGLIRQIVVIRALSILFNNSQLKPKLMHPDGCMGFSAIGNNVLLFCSLFILWGSVFALTLFGSFASTTHDTVWFSTLVGVGVYVVVVPLFLFLPTIAPHMAMKKAREEALEKVAVQIRAYFHDPDKNQSPADRDSLSHLEHIYALTEQNFTTWPFPTRTIRNFCIVALLPILTALIPLIGEMLKGN